MQHNHEAWLAANTFYCPRLKARLTRAACQTNLKLPTLRDKLGGTSPGAPAKRMYRPFACEGCVGPDADGNVKPREEEVMREKAKRVCLRCKKEKPIVARGLCGGCYDAARKAGELDTLYPATGRGGRPATRPPADTKSETIGAPVEKKPALPETPVAEQKAAMPEEADAISTFKIVQLDFSQHSDLLELLRDQANKEIRDLPGQIMWELKRAMAIAVLPPCAYSPKKNGTEDGKPCR